MPGDGRLPPRTGDKNTIRCVNCGAAGHLAKDCRKAKKTGLERPCLNCNKPGHLAKDCPDPNSLTAGHVGKEDSKNDAQGQAYSLCVQAEDGFVKVAPRRPVPVGVTIGDYIAEALQAKMVKDKQTCTCEVKNSFQNLDVECPGSDWVPPADEPTRGDLSNQVASRQTSKAKHAGGDSESQKVLAAPAGEALAGATPAEASARATTTTSSSTPTTSSSPSPSRSPGKSSTSLTTHGCPGSSSRRPAGGVAAAVQPPAALSAPLPPPGRVASRPSRKPKSKCVVHDQTFCKATCCSGSGSRVVENLHVQNMPVSNVINEHVPEKIVDSPRWSAQLKGSVLPPGRPRKRWTSPPPLALGKPMGSPIAWRI